MRSMPIKLDDRQRDLKQTDAIFNFIKLFADNLRYAFFDLLVFLLLIHSFLEHCGRFASIQPSSLLIRLAQHAEIEFT